VTKSITVRAFFPYVRLLDARKYQWSLRIPLMRLASLLSGGKDSVYAAHLMQRDHQLAYMVSMKPENPDSYMFHTVNIDITRLQAEAWGVPYVEAWTRGVKEEELDDLKATLAKLDIDGVITGAIASKYQADRVNALCDQLGLTHLSPLWARDREQLLHEMLDSGMEIIFSAVAAHGLDQGWLGEQLTPERIAKLRGLSDRFGVDMCGEGGEYESLVVDAPWFSGRIEIIESGRTWDGVSGRYNIKKAQLAHR
jgi:ABC transporter with metal-binding/Fe-S-binding domain ATP-binding protein